MKVECSFVLFWLVLALSLVPAALTAQEEKANYDESKVPQYTLPDPLLCRDGSAVTDKAAWTGKRRPEILELFTEQVYGRAPGRTQKVSYTLRDSSLALEGAALRKQVDITFGQGGRTLTVGVLIYLPAEAAGPVPAFLGLNFGGNQTVSSDPGIFINANWMRPNPEKGVVDNKANEASRGASASRWDIPAILGSGYALVTAYYGDIDPDYPDSFANGAHGLFQSPPPEPRPAEAWGSIAAWAWGLSRILDYLESDSQIDSRHVVVLGHSRLGKTALWAGATDQRFAGVISNNSGCGGAALSRRAFGETVEIINTSFPHWFCGNFKQYNGHEDKLPVDQHELIALVAPRPVYVASATEDRWADPHGEFLALKAASPVYKLLTGDSLAASAWPAPDSPVRGRMAYHLRTGVHDVTPYDWAQYIRWADEYVKGK